MGLARNILKGVKDRLMKNYGDKIASSLADTSSDAPSNFAAPKRDLYDKPLLPTWHILLAAE